MKTIIFVLLKIAEILGAALAYGLLCWLGKWLTEVMDLSTFYIFNPLNFMVVFIAALFTFAACWLIYGVVMVLIPSWLDLNKQWTNNIYSKIKRK